MATVGLALLGFIASGLMGCGSLPPQPPRTATYALAANQETALGKLVQTRRSATRATSESGFSLLDRVDQAYAARIALVDAAQRSLDLQYYAIHADASTEALLQRLRAAAQRGVRVRILLDDFNAVGPDAQVLRLAFERNMEVRLFNPLPGSRSSAMGRVINSLNDVTRIQKRMHNKLFIADNAMGITGGRNLGDAYFGQSTDSNFVDLDVLAAGGVVRDMSASFDRYWNDPLAYPAQALLKPGELDALREPATPVTDGASPSVAPAAPAASAIPVTANKTAVLPDVSPTAVVARSFNLQQMTLTWAPALLLVDKPGKLAPDDDEAAAGDTLIDGLLQLMGQAKQEVLIVSPYFVPGAPMMKTFAELRARGIRVRVLTNSLASNDAPLAHAGYARYRKPLLALGVELHELHVAQRAKTGMLGSGGSNAGGGGGPSAGTGSGIGSGAGSGVGSGAESRASLHAKAIVIDGRLAIIGSMNLDLRSQLKNSEVALLVRSANLARQASQQIANTITQGSYRLELSGGALVWRAPQGANFTDATSEPDAGFRQKMLVNMLGPFAPDEML